MQTVPHPSGGEYHPDHIQTPKEMPPLTQPAPALEPEVTNEPEPEAKDPEVLAEQLRPEEE